MNEAEDEPLTPEEQQQIDSLSSDQIEAEVDEALAADEGLDAPATAKSQHKRGARVEEGFKSPHKHWKLLVKEGSLDEAVLQPSSFVTDKELRKLKHTYPDHLEVTNTIKR